MSCAPLAERMTVVDDGRYSSMDLLALKLTLTPLIIAAVTLAGRRWGPAVSGWLVGMPLTSGPLSLYLSLEYGESFAARAAVGTMMGLLSSVAFCVVYARVAHRFSWPPTILVSLLAFIACTAVLRPFSPDVIIAFIVVVVGFVLSLRAFPSGAAPILPTARLRMDIPLRMVSATLLVLLVTEFASLLGPRLSGLLSPLPVFGSILVVFTHHEAGPVAAGQLLRGVMVGSFAHATYFVIVASFVESSGIALTYCIATLSALGVQGASRQLLNMRMRTAGHTRFG